MRVRCICCQQFPAWLDTAYSCKLCQAKQKSYIKYLSMLLITPVLLLVEAL